MHLDLSKQTGVFDVARLADRRIAVVGCGAVGSAIALHLAKLGLTNIKLYDYDRVEPQNICNQVLYGPASVGEYKVDAARDAIDRLTGTVVHTLRGKITAERATGGLDHFVPWVPEPVVFCCVDTMAARDYLFNTARSKLRCEYWADGRMNARDVAAYGFDPRDVRQSADYVSTLYPDTEVDDSRGTCGVTLSIGATAATLAAHMIWQFINHWMDAEYDNEILTRADRPSGQVLRKFDRTTGRKVA